MKMQEIGSYAFIAGVIIAVIAAFVSLDAAIGAGMTTALLVLIGIIVGFINVTEKETNAFLMAAVSVVLVSYLAGTGFRDVLVIGPQLQAITNGIMSIVTPAVIIVALKQIWAIAKSA
jgi:cellobiose-specific phosphotransferase system component IIB